MTYHTSPNPLLGSIEVGLCLFGFTDARIAVNAVDEEHNKNTSFWRSILFKKFSIIRFQTTKNPELCLNTGFFVRITSL